MTVALRLFLFSCVFAFPFASAAGELPPAGADPVFDELFGSGAESRPTAPDPAWRPGHGTVVWIDDGAIPGPRLIEFDPATGNRRILVDHETWHASWPEDRGEAPALDGLVWRPDGEAFLVAGDDDPAVWNLKESSLDILATRPGIEEHSSFSPDGSRTAWVRDNDLWVYDFSTGLETRLSSTGSETVFNGIFDWVYQEDFAHREPRAYKWSDDGAHIVWLSLNDSDIPVFHLVDAMETHSKVTEQRYPKPGDPMPRPTLHAATFDEDRPDIARWDGTIDDPIPYLPRFGFTPDAEVWYQKLDRDQHTLDLMVVDRETHSANNRLVEKDPHWIRPVDGSAFLDDGSILWLSRASGHTHLIRVRSDGYRINLSPGKWVVTEIVGVSSDGRFAWYQAARPGPRERRIYRVELSTGETVEVTTSAGTHDAVLEPGGERLLIRSSSAGAPPRWRIVDGRGNNAAEIPVEHPVPSIDYAEHRFVEITAADGVKLEAMLLLPPGFDESRRHPVVVYTYGGPNAQVVVDAWPRSSGLFNHALTHRGFVVFALDNRGSAARGRAFEGAVDHALGSKQLPDQLAGVAWLKEQPWVAADRIGIWGWSYGGYMTTLALTHAPGVFAAGAAVAPVTDWRLYDSIYTERYMGTPEANPAGYAAGSVLDAVAALDEPLLVIHGTGDDNVHLQHTLQLADRAWREGKRFDLVVFPNLAHSIKAPGSHLQVFSAIADFFEKHLGVRGGNG